MAEFTEAKSKHWTLTSNNVDSLAITGQHTGLEIIHHADNTNPIYFLVGTAALVPTVAGDDMEVVLPGERIRVSVPQRGGTVVSVISAGTPRLSVVSVL